MRAAARIAAIVRRSRAGRDIVAVSGDLVVNVAEAIDLASRMALAPPDSGEWSLVGREDDLVCLHDHLSRHDQAVITGLGGLGKTALALGYVARYRAGYDLVAWVDADRPELIPGRYRALVRNRTGQDLPETEAVDEAKALLANSGKWLVVFDNASTPADLHPYLPSGEGRILVTTRNETWSANAQLTLALEKLPRPVVVEWLTRALPGSCADAIKGLTERLDGLPLAIVQAVAYITARPDESASSYLVRYDTKEGQRALLHAKTPPGYPHPVATTWAIATETLAFEAPQALDLLRYLAFVNPDMIPLAILDGLLPGADTPGLLEALRSLGMVRCSTTHASLHRLVQDVTRLPLSPEQENAYIERWGWHLKSVFPEVKDHAAALDWLGDIASHLMTLTHHASVLGLSSADVWGLANKTGISRYLEAGYNPAVTVFDVVRRIFEVTYGADDPKVAGPLSLLGITDQELGRHQEGIGFREWLLQMREGGHASDHPEMARPLMELGNVFQDVGEPEDAIEPYELALRIREAQVAITLTCLGDAHRRLGHHQEAIGLYERALRLKETAYSPDHPQVAVTLNNLAIAHQELGHDQEGPELFERAMHINEDAYNPDHPEAAIPLTNLAIAQTELGHSQEAVELYERALRIFEAAYGPNHPHSRKVQRLLEQPKPTDPT